MNRSFLPVSAIFAAALLFVLLIAAPSAETACRAANADALVTAMKASYSRVQDYRTRVEVKEFGEKGELRETKRFLYTLKKPDHIRIDFESPHKGTVLIYPDKRGKVAVLPSGLPRLLTLHLSPNNPLLHVSTGQRIDQTDMGLLIRNIAHSLTDQRLGRERITEENGTIRVETVAENHFTRGKITLYRFFIDKNLCLPTRIEELTPDRIPRRVIIFHQLRINNGIQVNLFDPGGGNK